MICRKCKREITDRASATLLDTTDLDSQGEEYIAYHDDCVEEFDASRWRVFR